MLQRVLVPLAEALQCVDLNQVNLVDAPEPDPVEPQFTLVESTTE